MKLMRRKDIQDILDHAEQHQGSEHKLSRHLGVRDLTAFGIAAIVGAGIFSTIGQASADGGPAVIFLFMFTALACGFAAFCYAEFASMVPVSGSAYTYSYVAFGELFAWIIGWALIMEYGIGNITVAISWSDYFTGLLAGFGIDLPAWMTMDYLSAHKGFNQASALLASGKPFENLTPALKDAYYSWTSAPVIGNFHLVMDIPALGIIIFITWLVYRGMKESRDASNLMVVVKLAVVLLVIAVGLFYVEPDNWSPFAPNGITGILKGVSAVFFAYIGFDAISTTAEECKDPQHDLPRGMMYAIIICTVLYMLIALVLTGMISSEFLAVGDPLAFVFQELDLKWMSGIIAFSAIFAMASVLLVFQMGQPRIWMSMSRDGLLPKRFSRIHPRFKTPSFATIVTGFLVAVPALFLNLPTVTDLCSIGTLFAFTLVCGGVLQLQNRHDIPRGKFRTPYINSRFILPLLSLIGIYLSISMNKEAVTGFFMNHPEHVDPTTLVTGMSEAESESVIRMIRETDSDDFIASGSDLDSYLNEMSKEDYIAFLASAPIREKQKWLRGWSAFKYKIPMYIFLAVTLFLIIRSVTHKLSLIPVLGVLSCLYMMAQIEFRNWIGFGIWLIVGLIIYFGYSYRNSRLATFENNE